MKLTLRGWVIYGAAWVPYALGYVAVFFAQSRTIAFLPAIQTALLNVIPAALAGVLAIKFCQKMQWGQHRRWWFFPAQVAAAIAYSLLWYAGVLLFLTAELSWRTKQFAPVWFGSYALQWQLFSGLMIYGTMASLVYVWQISANLAFEKQRAARAEMLAVEAQLTVLRAQLNPHFLFNTLHSLMALTRYAPDKAENALERLAEMLRYVLKESHDAAATLVPLRDELNFVGNYLELEKLRLDDRLRVVNEINSDALDCLVPALTLQPLVENAIKHGISPRARSGTISIVADRCGEYLELAVRDTGLGAVSETIEKSIGTGLKLVRQQLQTHYNDRMEMKIDTAPELGFSVVIKLPWHTNPIKETEAGSAAQIAYSRAHY